MVEELLMTGTGITIILVEIIIIILFLSPTNRRCLMNILSNFYTTDIVNDQRYKFSPSGVYYAPPKGSYEDYVEFIKELPMTQNPEIFGMHDNVDISRELQETRQVREREREREGSEKKEEI